MPMSSIALGAALLQAGTGAAQAIKGRQIAKRTVRPTYSMPESVRKNLAMDEANANVGMNAASKQIAMQGIDRGTAAVLNAGSSRRAGLAGLAGVVTSNNDAFSNLAAMDEMARLRNQEKLRETRNTVAGYEDKAWQLNKFDPYQMKVEESQALKGAGMQNIGGALNTAAMVGMTGMGDGTGAGKTKAPGFSPTDYVPPSIGLPTSIPGGYQGGKLKTNGINPKSNPINMNSWYRSMSPEQRKLMFAVSKNEDYK